MKSIAWSLVTALALAGLGRAGTPAAEDPAGMVRSYFAAGDEAGRASAAARIAAHADYRPSRLRDWLHAGYPFTPQAPGLQAFPVDVGGGLTRRVALIVPEGYRPDRAWPLVYALHPSGMPAEEWARQMERTLGRRAREFLIASPEFEQNYIFAKPPFVPEHPAILDAVARRVHVAADRVYPFGLSKGGFGAWFVALYYPDRVAGAISMAAGFDVAPGEDGFWKLLVGNVANTPVVNTWGENDPLRIPGLDEKPGATFAESNRLFEREVRGMGLPILNVEVPGGGHGNLVPPAEPLIRLLEQRRKGDPGRVAHTFRHLHQASCYWLEGLSWAGESWGDPPAGLFRARRGVGAAGHRPNPRAVARPADGDDRRPVDHGYPPAHRRIGRLVRRRHHRLEPACHPDRGRQGGVRGPGDAGRRRRPGPGARDDGLRRPPLRGDPGGRNRQGVHRGRGLDAAARVAGRPARHALSRVPVPSLIPEFRVPRLGPMPFGNRNAEGEVRAIGSRAPSRRGHGRAPSPGSPSRRA